jgi:beta-galactosidase
MNATVSVQVTADGLLIGDNLLPLYSGSVHYWQHERADWPKIVANVRQMGYRFLDTYFPWNVHEAEPGRFDFGQLDPRKNIASFLRECKDAGLYVLARPGPHINAELPTIGFPQRILDNPEIQSLTVTGAPAVIPVVNTPFIAPSYACDAFYTEVGQYFDALAPILRDFIFPNGPIVAFQADNEMSFCFRMRCYDVDYHPDAIKLYQGWLARKYGDITALNDAYHSAYRHFNEVDAPREFVAQSRSDLPYYLDWAGFQEYYIQYGLIRIEKMLQERGLTGVPYYHNYPTFYPEAPFRMAALEQELDIAGVDAYPQPRQYPLVKRGAQYTSTMSRLPFVPEFGSGVWAWYRPLDVEGQQFNMRAAFMHGIRAINYYMLADRDRWLNCPLKRDGTARDDMFKLHQDWNAQLHALNWSRLRPERDILILTPRLYDQLRYVAIEACIPYDWLFSFYCQLPPDLFASENTFGLRDVIQITMPSWIAAFRKAFEVLGVPYALGDSDIRADQLRQYSAVVVPTFEWFDSELCDKLDKYVQSGGRLICGPRAPKENIRGEAISLWAIPLADVVGQRIELGQHLWLENADLWRLSESGATQTPFIYRLRRGKGDVFLATGVFPPPSALEGSSRAYGEYAPYLETVLHDLGILPRWTSNNTQLDVTILSGDGRRIVCVANPTPEAQQGYVFVPTITTWIDVDTMERNAGTLTLNLDPWTIKIWEVS